MGKDDFMTLSVVVDGDGCITGPNNSSDAVVEERSVLEPAVPAVEDEAHQSSSRDIL
jgi:hypothetical protein